MIAAAFLADLQQQGESAIFIVHIFAGTLLANETERSRESRTRQELAVTFRDYVIFI